ncbi:MAG: SDR family oxidoreductase [Pseudomonadales bacterium]|nr:SDR family oxidoreductase [Pseudomonadales bacterium]
MKDLEGKTVVVMGGTSGIGLATARQIEERGASVWALGRSAAKIEVAGKHNPKINFLALDTHDIPTLKQFLNQRAPIDHVVSAATGANRTMAPFMEQTDEQFREAFDKFWGYCNVIRQCVPFLAKNASITLVSGTPARKCVPGMSSVSCVGSAVEALTRALALELAPIRVNAVAPGIIDTAMFDHFGDNKSTIFEQMSQNIPLRRVGQAEEVASAIVLTLCNNFMTGTTIDVDGGQLLP